MNTNWHALAHVKFVLCKSVGTCQTRDVFASIGTRHIQNDLDATAKFRRRTSHEPNRMLMRENKGFFSFAFDSAHVKYGV